MTPDMRAQLQASIDSARSQVAGMGLRPWGVALRRRSWSGGAIGDGDPTDVDVSVDPTPNVEWPDEGRPYRRLNWGEGDALLTKVSRVLPESWLMGRDREAGEEVIYVLTHPDTRTETHFRPIGTELRNFEYRVRLLQVSTAPVAGLVTWRARGQRSFDARTSQAAYAETMTRFRGNFGPLALKEVGSAQGLKVGDVRLRLLPDDLAAPPRPEDRFTFEGADYAVFAVEESERKTYYTAYGRRS